MAHGIILPIDQIISTEGNEWHGLATQVPEINREVAEPLLFDIVHGQITVQIDGQNVPMSNHKALVADFRKCRPDLINSSETSNGLVPLHIPKESYRPIPNSDVWDAMEGALKDIDARVSCVGTLEAGKKFFISAQLNKGNKFKVNGDEFHANLNFITSHDGTLGCEAYDSIIRIVCMNTLRWSREAAGEMKFKVYHTDKSEFAMKNLPGLINRILQGRADFRSSMEYLAGIKINEATAMRLGLGYFYMKTPNKKEDMVLSTRSLNAAEEIVRLFKAGRGNKGESLYDLLNGATEYWTSGDGVGKTAGRTVDSEKMYKASFGAAAVHKDDFMGMLLDEKFRKETEKQGKELQKHM